MAIDVTCKDRLGVPQLRKRNYPYMIMRMVQLIVWIFVSTLPSMALVKHCDTVQVSGIRNAGPKMNHPFLTTSVVDGELFLDVPKEVLGRRLLFVRYDQGSHRRFLQVIWSLQGDRMLLKVPSVRSTTGITLPVAPNLTITDNILAIFPLKKDKGEPGSYRVNITSLVLQQRIEWEPGFAEELVPEITMLMGAKDLDDEVIIKTRRGLVKGGFKVSVPIFFGFTVLPDPMKARRFDYRMGFYNEESSGMHLQLRNGLANISRWRLEKRFQDQEVSVPINPINFLLSPDIPKKWRPYIKAGIEEWLPAFESAGFKDALVVKELDTLDEWTAHSIHSNIVYWSGINDIRGSEYGDYGGTAAKIVDLRTGEILRGDIFISASERTVMERYFVRSVPLDQRARQFPFPDELVGSLFQVIVAHEAGHVFGLKDANYGEFSYPWEKMKDSVWLRNMGHTPSIMNYARSSNLPQPEDSVPPDLLVQRVGPTDRYNIQWAYTEFPKDISGKGESMALEKMIRWQDSVPWYRFNNAIFESIGPATSSEVVETNDPVRSTGLALKNLERVISLLPKVTLDQKDNARLGRLHEKTLELWYNHMVHVSTLIGGYDIQYKPLGQQGQMYTPIPWEKQSEAMEFLLANAFDPPKWLTQPSFYSKTMYSTFPDYILGYQQRLLSELVMAPRLRRLEFMESSSASENMVQNYLDQLQSGLFRELQYNHAPVESQRQTIQILYIDLLVRFVQQKGHGPNSEERFFFHSDYVVAQFRMQLKGLKKTIQNGMKRNWDDVSMAHWERCLEKIYGM